MIADRVINLRGLDGSRKIFREYGTDNLDRLRSTKSLNWRELVMMISRIKDIYNGEFDPGSG